MMWMYIVKNDPNDNNDQSWIKVGRISKDRDTGTMGYRLGATSTSMRC